MSVHFEVSFPAISLAVNEIWPDGDAPTCPSAEDVITKMKENGLSAVGVMREWYIMPDTFDVNGVPFR